MYIQDNIPKNGLNNFWIGSSICHTRGQCLQFLEIIKCW